MIFSRLQVLLAALMFSNPDTFKERNDTDVCAASGRVL